MAYNIESVPLYYGEMNAKQSSFIDFMRNTAIVKDIDNSITSNTDRSIAANAFFTESINSRIVDAQIASTNAMYNNTQAMVGAFQSGFSHMSRQIGEMSVGMSMGFAALNTSIQKSAQAIYDRLDTINDILNNPSLTKSRELFRRASVNYNKGFFEEARNDLLEALASNKTDYISWFLLGKTYLFGTGEFSTVIDLDAAVDALKNATKYITPDARKEKEAQIMASEMCFYLGLAQQIKAMDLLHTQNEANCRNYLDQAGGSYSQSYDYSAKMLEAKYNSARCKALLGDISGAIADLETVILEDRNYCVKVCADNDFLRIGKQFADLIKKLKNRVFISAKNDYDHIKTLLSELALHIWNKKLCVPPTFTEDIPYFDVLDYAVEFKRAILILENTNWNSCISAGKDHTVGLKSDGTVVACGDSSYDICNVNGWRNIIAVSAGHCQIVGLKADGTVVAVGNSYNGNCNVDDWRNIIAVSAGWYHTVGLKVDGTVVAVGGNTRYASGFPTREIHCGQCDVSGWRDIIAVSAGCSHTVGLKVDGTVVAAPVGFGYRNVSDWCNIGHYEA